MEKNSHIYAAIKFSLALEKCIYNQFSPFKQAGRLFKFQFANYRYL